MTLPLDSWPALIALAVGHVALFVVVLNVVHATSMPERRLNVINLIWLALLLGGLAGLLFGGPWTAWPLPGRVYAIACLVMTLGVLPLVTAIRALRRPPAGIAVRGEDLDLGSGPGAVDAIGDGHHNWLLRLPGNHALRLRKLECDLTLPGLPRAFDGLAIVHLTDLHFARCYRREFFEAVADEAARWDADLIAFTGDLLDDPETYVWTEPVMGRLRGRLGQFSILGNHDHLLRPGRARRCLRKAGFTDLEGRWERIEIDGASLIIGGTSAPWGTRIDFQNLPEADFRLLLSHSPDQFPAAASGGVDLVLAGHNHGGQVRIPGFGPLLMPSRYCRHFDRGFFRQGRSTLYVSQGIGGKHPIRYGCTPEITRFTLRAAPAPASHLKPAASLARQA
ncbi:metallophosphoesterase [Tundrisphaera sp. TA3]|uniref:metallophosphoesterase n=1 Tax=Tundrisphaera sp. TA3 TaxID=3435775 RepID=UPI003EBB693F